MAPGFYRAMAACVLSLHAAYIAWVIFGAFFTRGRPRLAALHVATLLLGDRPPAIQHIKKAWRRTFAGHVEDYSVLTESVVPSRFLASTLFGRNGLSVLLSVAL